jgi:hypothetical protein
MYTKLCSNILKGRGHLRELGVNEDNIKIHLREIQCERGLDTSGLRQSVSEHL